MIKINFATRKKPSSGTAKGMSELKFDATQFRAIWAQLKEFPLKRMASVTIIAIAASTLVEGYEDDQVNALKIDLDKLLAEKPRLEAETKKMNGLQETQKSMENDEKRIRTKLDTIKKLITDRGVATSVLQEVSRITPPNVWMSEFSMNGSDLSFKGLSQDFGNISDFTKMIQSSAMFSGMTLKDTQIASDDQKRQIASFSLTARRK